MILSVSRTEERVTLCLTNDQEVMTVKCQPQVYDVLKDIPSEGIGNKELQFRIVQSLRCSHARATSIIEKFTPGYKAFCGIALIEGFSLDGSRERLYRPVQGVGTPAAMMTHKPIEDLNKLK